MCMIHKLQMLDMHVCACFHFRQVRNKKKQRKATSLSDTITVTREEYSKDLLSVTHTEAYLMRRNAEDQRR